MVPLACVEVPGLRLQLLARSHAAWAREPVAVVDRDHPQGVVTALNERAYARGIRLGMRYGVALGLEGALRAGVVSDEEEAAAVRELLALLHTSSPRVEPCAEEPGVFWVDTRGLTHLYPDLTDWAAALWAKLREARWAAAIACGFRRFRTYVIAKSYRGRGVVVLRTPEEEAAAAARVPLRHLALPPEAHAVLAKLGVGTVRAFEALPAAGILRRFGKEALRLHRMATGEAHEALDAAPAAEPLTTRRVLDDGETQTDRLLFLVKQDLTPLLAKLAARGEALAELTVTLHGAKLDACARDLVIQPAEPTLDAALLAGLVHLRLESVSLTGGVTELGLTAAGVTATREQLALFAERKGRDLRAGSRALARVRALFGPESVVSAALTPGHLPEATFTWKPLTTLVHASPRPAPELTVVRRVERRPALLPPTPMRTPEGWLLLGIEHGPVVHTRGPYVLSGGWWQGEVEREYFFARLHSGEWLWVFFDRRRRRWFLQGRVR